MGDFRKNGKDTQLNSMAGEESPGPEYFDSLWIEFLWGMPCAPVMFPLDQTCKNCYGLRLSWSRKFCSYLCFPSLRSSFSFFLFFLSLFSEVGRGVGVSGFGWARARI